jgi:hypothetical protein
MSATEPEVRTHRTCALNALSKPLAFLLLKGTSANHGQPRLNTFHHPEKLLREDDEDGDGP